MRREKNSTPGRFPRYRLLASLILVAVAALLVVSRVINQNRQAGGVTMPVVQVQTESAGAFTAAGQDGDSLLHVSLSQGQAQPLAAAAIIIAEGEPLTTEEIQQILDRLPPLEEEPGDAADFRLRESSLPPPRTGETILEPFPPPPPATAPPAVAGGPLEVLRYAPEGEVPAAPFLSVTFNQPMVALDTVENLAAAEVPVTMTPALPGQWRWLGTQTLTFEYTGQADRLPMATEYVVEVPAGTRSATGGVLAESVTWRFGTPPPTVQTVYPQGDAQPLQPVFFIAFDQAVDPAAVLATSRLTAGSQDYPLRLATAAEVEADATVQRLAQDGRPERQFAFRPQQSLPPDTEFQLSVGPGTPSAEGPLVTAAAQTYRFHTYASLRVTEHRCSWYDAECPPLTPFYIAFNNPLDPEAYDEAMVRITPELPGAVVNLSGASLTIQGMTQGRVTYRVTLDASLQDVFGQTLGRDTTLSFRVGPAPRLLSGPDRPFITLDPSRPSLTLYSINFNSLRLRAYAVTPADWSVYQAYLRNYYNDPPPTPPGRLVVERNIPVEAAADTLTETAVDLSDALNNGFGHLVVIVEPAAGLFDRDRDRYSNRVQAWVQATQIGLDAFVDHSQMVAWATGLADGAPLAGVTIQQGSGDSATTGADGVARLDLPGSSAPILIARQDEDVAILPAGTYYWDSSGWQRRPLTNELRWYVFDDRGMYRPGEEVHIKGWLRRIDAGPTGDVGLVGQAVVSVRYQVIDAWGNELLNGAANVNALGGFDLAFTLPDTVNLGHTTLQLQATGATGGLSGLDYGHYFQVQEFRRPEFEVAARNETPGPYFAGEQATVAVAASYYAGGPLPNADVTWRVTSTPGHYAPPNWPDFIFGVWTPWWWFDYGYEFGGPIWPEAEQVQETFSGVTDAGGQHYLQLDFEALGEPRPFTVQAEATVMDVNRQAWTAATNLLVHPADLYVGLRSRRTFVPQGTPLEIETIVTDLDGAAIAGRAVQVRAARLEWRTFRGQWREEEADVQECAVSSAAGPVTCTFTTAQGGTYRITATVSDDQGRTNQSQFTRWVSGGRRPAARQVEQESLTLIPDKESYQPGDVAEILVQAPFSPAEGMLIVSRSGLLSTERFHLEGDSHTLHVPITEAHIPNLNIQVDLVGAAPRTDDAGALVPGAPPRPAYASGRLNLAVPPLSRTLTVQAALQEAALAPGQSTTLDVTVSDAAGVPVAGAEVAVVVVDEAVLALTGYRLADPLAVFYQTRPSLVDSYYGRASIVLVNPQALAQQTETFAAMEVMATAPAARVLTEVGAEEAAMDMAAPLPGAPPAEGASPIAIRRDFNPLATFVPAVSTGADGRAQVTIQLPDNLTRYRVMVVAVAGEKQFGATETNLTARLPLMVRPSAPRFLNFGDRFELPVVVQNQTNEPLTVDIVAQVTNLELTTPAGRRVTVPANDRVEVRFPATTLQPGTARFQIAAVSGAYADAAVGHWPVYTPATTEAFATYGVLDAGAVAQPVALPQGVFPQFGGLEITTSSTAVQALTDAVLYLVQYPYECSEQLASRILAVAALRDVLTAFAAEGLPAPAELEAAVQRDIERLQSLQNDDGGFPIWQRGYESWPYYSIYAAHALHVAQVKGFTVSADTQQRALSHLRQIENHYPHWYGPQVRYSLSAYALHVRFLMGDSDPAKARNLLNQAGLETLSLEAAAWLWPVLSDDPAAADIERHLNNRAVETASAANFFTSYGDDDYLMLHSNRRTDAVILDALIALRPQSDLIPKVVNGLLAQRVRGRWGNTQENTFVLLALDRYFNTFEAETPEFVTRIWLGEGYAGDHAFVGRTTERHQTDIPMRYLVDTDQAMQDLILSKEGPGRLYYRLGLRYAPDDLSLEPLDMGFVVQREYEAVDNPEDVYRDEEGVWHIRAGARVRVRLTLVATTRRYHVALVDPLPAGLEIINPDLAVSESLPQDPNESGGRFPWWWWYRWYQHQNLRDERAEAFTTLLWDGVYTYSYVARATTPGAFVVPPARAEEMYTPETFGRTATDWVIVE